VALHAVYHSAQATGLPIIGMGGVASGQDALEFLAAGASLVGVGTALFRDPGLPASIVAELDALLAARGAGGVAEVVGAAQEGLGKPSPHLEGMER